MIAIENDLNTLPHQIANDNMTRFLHNCRTNRTELLNSYNQNINTMRNK